MMNKKEAQFADKWRRRNAKSLEKMAVKYPCLMNQDSDEFRFLEEFRELFVCKLNKRGDILEKGVLYPLFYDPEWPEKIIPLAMAIFPITPSEKLKYVQLVIDMKRRYASIGGMNEKENKKE